MISLQSNLAFASSRQCSESLELYGVYFRSCLVGKTAPSPPPSAAYDRMMRLLLTPGVTHHLVGVLQAELLQIFMLCSHQKCRTDVDFSLISYVPFFLPLRKYILPVPAQKGHYASNLSSAALML